MKWPLLGIIVVLCLQLGFTAFNSHDRPIESLIAVNELTRGTNPVADLNEDLTVTHSPKHFLTREKIVLASTWRRKALIVEPAYVSGKRNLNTADSAKFRRMSRYVAMQRPFESTVITYPRVIGAVSESDNYPITPQTGFVVTQEKRSFISKTASILKKPYTWLKALGSKIN